METLEAIEKKLGKSGWHLRPLAVRETLEQVLQQHDQEARHPRDYETAVTVELLDTDIKLVGLRCLPDLQSLMQTQNLQGLRVLQVVSIVDVSESCHRIVSGSQPQQSRLLRVRLSDGHSSVTGIEYRPIPFLSADIAPGTKVLLGNTVPQQSGILLLDGNCIQLLGGHVPALYDAWEYNLKYSGVSRDAGSKESLLDGASRPPPFRALQLTRSVQQTVPKPMKQIDNIKTASEDSQSSASAPMELSATKIVRTTGVSGEAPVAQESSSTLVSVSQESSSKPKFRSKPRPAIRPGSEPYRPRAGQVATIAATKKNLPVESTDYELAEHQHATSMPISDKMMVSHESHWSGEPPQVSNIESPELEEGRKSEIKERPLSGSEVVTAQPLQNRKAAQKLLDRKSETNSWQRRGGHGKGFGRTSTDWEGGTRGGRRAGRGTRDDDPTVLTWDEWEAKRVNVPANDAHINNSRIDKGSHVSDEELAHRLQQQLNSESQTGSSGNTQVLDEAEQLRLSMFSFRGDLMSTEDGTSRGRGRGRGKGRGRGRRNG